jgi:hypothetical protein
MLTVWDRRYLRITSRKIILVAISLSFKSVAAGPFFTELDLKLCRLKSQKHLFRTGVGTQADYLEEIIKIVQKLIQKI